MTISLLTRTKTAFPVRAEKVKPLGVSLFPALASLGIDPSADWRESTVDHVRATFRRIVARLNTSPDGLMASEIFANITAGATGSDTISSGTMLGHKTASIPGPIGTALIVSAPSCSVFTVAENVAAALAARNCVELALFERPDPQLSSLIETLGEVLPEGIFTVLSEQTGWGSRGPDTAIVILTPENAFMNERPWVRAGAGTTGSSLVAFYTRWHEISAAA